MKKITTIILLTVITIAAITCKKTPEIPTGGNKIEIGETTIDSLSYSTAKVSTIISATGGNEISQHGHCWSTKHDPTTGNNKTILGKITQPKTYTSELTNLINNTSYYVRSYVTYTNGKVYGIEQTIQTFETRKPIVTTNEATNITINSVTCGGTNDNGGLTISQRGVCWNNTGNPTLENNIGQTTYGTGTGSFISEITGLNDDVTYYVTAYATNEKGTSYGEVKQFETVSSTLPTVTTTEITNITTISATSGGNVTSNGNGTVTARGICWNTTGNPTLQNSLGQINDGSGTGVFTSEITGLNNGVTYYTTAYATNEKGTAYGYEVLFETLDMTPCDGQTSITYEGYTYNTVEIDYQCWMKENLNYQTGNSWCYDNDPTNCETYGRLYDWETIMNGETSSNTVPSGVQGICPVGWHLPSDEEWKILEGNTDTHYGVGDPEWDGTGYRGYDAGKRLKTITGWNQNTGTNAVGFSALPGGTRYSSGSFFNLGSYGYWWSSSEYSGTSAWRRDLYYGSDQVSRRSYSKTYGFSVRCLKN